jgi:uncharacterized membrane protein YbhN (UPF0104 family)
MLRRMVTAVRRAADGPAEGGRTVRLFASPSGVPRVRRVLDALTLVGAVAALALLAWWGQPTRGFERSLASAADAAPAWVQTFWVFLYDWTLLLPLVVLVAAVVRRRWAILLQGATAAVAAVVLLATTSALAADDWPSIPEALGIGDAVAWPAAALSIATSMLVAAASDVTAPIRRLGAWLLAAAVVVSVLAGRTTPTGAIAALLVAAAAAATARLVVGTTAGHLSRQQVVDLLEALGVRVTGVEWLRREPDGLVVAGIRGADDEPMLVRVRGRDAAESRRVERLWRALAYRDGGGALAQARSPGLEREALTTLLAAARGVPVWPVVAAGRPDGTGEAMALRVDGTLVADLPADAVDEAAAASAWRALQSLHAARLAHLGLAPRALVLRPDGTVAFTAFADAVTAATTEATQTDDAQLLACLAVSLGPERAVAGARAALGPDALAGVLPFLQPAALPASLRAAARDAGLDVNELRATAAAAIGVDEPQLARLRRVSRGGVLRTGLLVLAAAAIVPAIAGIDLGRLRTSVAESSWSLLALAFVVAQLPRLAQTVSTLGSVPARLPFGPAYAMQLATAFLNVALPSGIARMALSVRFFQRQGVAPATAVAAGLIDSFVGNVIQALLLVGLVVFGSTSFELDVDVSAPRPHAAIVLAGVAVLAVVGLAAFLFRARLRGLVARARGWLPEARAALRPLRDGSKLAQLIGGNVAAELLFASALMLFAHAFGADVGLVEVLFVNMTTSLLVSVIPIPGGIGVAEATLVVGLTRAGLEEEAAFATAVCYRLATFYLPPAWGYLALRWLGRHDYV